MVPEDEWLQSYFGVSRETTLAQSQILRDLSPHQLEVIGHIADSAPE